MTSRSQRDARPKAKRSLMSRAKEFEATREVRVGHGYASASRTKGGGVLGLNKKAKLQLGRAAAKTLISGTIKKNKAKAGK